MELYNPRCALELGATKFHEQRRGPSWLTRTARKANHAGPLSEWGLRVSSQVKLLLPKFHRADSALRSQAAGGVGVCASPEVKMRESYIAECHGAQVEKNEHSSPQSLTGISGRCPILSYGAAVAMLDI